MAENTEETKKEAAAAPMPAKHKPLWAACAIVSVLLAIGAWIAMVVNEYASFWLAVAGLAVAIASCVGLKKCMWRDWAITAIIACAVLLLVFGIFYFAVEYLLNTL